MNKASLKPSFFLPLFLIAALCTTLLFGCKKESTPDKKQLIIGKWLGVSEQWEDYTNGSLTGSGNAAAEFDLFFTFKADGTVVEENFEEPTDPSITTYNYVLNGDKLIISLGSNYNEELTITELTKTALKFKSEESYTSNGVNYKYIRILVFKKVS